MPILTPSMRKRCSGPSPRVPSPTVTWTLSEESPDRLLTHPWTTRVRTACSSSTRRSPRIAPTPSACACPRRRWTASTSRGIFLRSAWPACGRPDFKGERGAPQRRTLAAEGPQDLAQPFDRSDSDRVDYELDVSDAFRGEGPEMARELLCRAAQWGDLLLPATPACHFSFFQLYQHRGRARERARIATGRHARS